MAKKGVHDQRGTAIAAAEGDLFEQECAADRERKRRSGAPSNWPAAGAQWRDLYLVLHRSLS